MSLIFNARQRVTTNSGLAVEAAVARQAAFMEAIVAAGVLMAYADGELAAAERRRLLLLLREIPMLASSSLDEFVDELATHEANFAFDPELAQVIAREKLVPLAGDTRLIPLVVDVCRRIIAADGVVHPAEQRTLAEIMQVLDADAPPSAEPPLAESHMQ